MSFTLRSALILASLAAPSWASDPLQQADYRERITGPALEPGSLEGKVVFLEYFGYY